jgi:hypothetical protein
MPEAVRGGVQLSILRSLLLFVVLPLSVTLGRLEAEDSAFTGAAEFTGIVKYYSNGSIIIDPPMANLIPSNLHWTVDANTVVTGTVKQYDLVSVQGDYTPGKEPGHLKTLTLVQSSVAQRAVVDAPPGDSGTLNVRNLQGREAKWKVDESTVIVGPVPKGQFKVGDAVSAMVFPTGYLAEINVEKRDVAVKPHQETLAELVNSGTAQDIQNALNAGANANTPDAEGVPVLILAAGSNPDPAVVTELLKAGADANVAFKIGTGTITPLVAAAWQNKSPEVVAALINGGANLTHDGGEALVAAASFNPNPEMILVLLKAGADASYLDPTTGKSALYFAQQRQDLKGSEALKELEAASTSKSR